MDSCSPDLSYCHTHLILNLFTTLLREKEKDRGKERRNNYFRAMFLPNPENFIPCAGMINIEQIIIKIICINSCNFSSHAGLFNYGTRNLLLVP